MRNINSETVFEIFKIITGVSKNVYTLLLINIQGHSTFFWETVKYFFLLLIPMTKKVSIPQKSY